MTEATLPGYETIVPNQIYAKKGKSVELVTLDRAHVSSGIQISNFIQREARRIIDEVKKLGEDLDIPAYWVQIPFPEVKRLAEGDKKSLKLLREIASSYHILQWGAKYLNATISEISPQIFESAEEAAKRERDIIFYRVASSRGRNKVNLYLRLAEGRELPSESELEHSLGIHTRLSDIMVIACAHSDYQKAEKIIRLLSKSLGAGEIPRIPYYPYLKAMAAKVLANFGNHVRHQNIEELLSSACVVLVPPGTDEIENPIERDPNPIAN